MCHLFPEGSWLVDCCYPVTQFLAEMTKTEKNSNSEPKLDF